MPRNDLIRLRRGTLADWQAADPPLAYGEPGLVIDGNGEVVALVIGDGDVDVFGSLPQFFPIDADVSDLINRWTPASSSAPASLRFAEDTDNGTNVAAVGAPASLGADRTLSLPDASGTLTTEEWVAARPGTVLALKADKIWSTGNITLTFSGSAAWVEVANAGGVAGFFDFTFAGVVAGQLVEMDVDALWLTNGAGNGFLDFATIVGGSPVNWFSSGGGTPDAFGLQGLFGAASVTGPRHGSYRYALKAGDISGGSATVRLMGEAQTVTKVLAGLGATGGRIRVGARLLAP